jgi:hypothetical protein
LWHNYGTVAHKAINLGRRRPTNIRHGTPNDHKPGLYLVPECLDPSEFELALAVREIGKLAAETMAKPGGQKLRP